MTNVFIGYIVVVHVIVIYTPPQDDKPEHSNYFSYDSFPCANKLVPSGVASSSLAYIYIYIDFFCSEQAKGLEVTCQGRYDDNLSVRHITGNHVVGPEYSEILNIRMKFNSPSASSQVTLPPPPCTAEAFRRIRRHTLKMI